MKKILLPIICILIIAACLVALAREKGSLFTEQTPSSAAVSARFVSSTITADGTVTAANEAVLAFQTPGKLTYLPFREGDTVYQGQTIAAIDTTALKEELQLAANAYETVQNTTATAMENNQAGVIEGQTRYSLDTSNKQAYAAITEDTVIYDTVQRIVANDLLAQNSAKINVDLANYAVSLASLTTPINGIILNEGVTVAGINITPATTFTVADPSSIVFRANIPAEDIYYITEGATVNVAIDGVTQQITGTIVKIYPSTVTLPNSETVYQVDIASDALKKVAKFGQTGTAIVTTNAQNVALVPAWTVLGGKYIWIDASGTPELWTVTVGKVHGNDIEVTSGLSPDDKIIVNPKYIPARMYQFL